MTEQEFFTEAGSTVYCKSFRELRTVYGFTRALRARLLRLRYTVKLWLLRETSIISVLLKNYEKIPPRSLSRFLIGIFARFAFLRKWNEKLGRKIQLSFTKNI